MNQKHADRVIHAFLVETRDQLPERSYAAIRHEIDSNPQRIVLGPWRTPFMNNFSQSVLPAIAVTLLAILAVASLSVLGFEPTPAPAATSSPASSNVPPTVPPSVTTLSQTQNSTQLDAATYGVTFLQRARFTITLPDGWLLNDLSSGSLDLLRESGSGESTNEIYVSGIDGVFRDPCGIAGGPTQVDQTVSAVTQELTHMSGVTASSPTPVEVGEVSGMTFTLDDELDTATSTCAPYGNLIEWSLPIGWVFSVAPGSHQRIWVLDVGGRPLVVNVVSYPAATEADRQSAEDIVNSMTFG